MFWIICTRWHLGMCFETILPTMRKTVLGLRNFLFKQHAAVALVQLVSKFLFCTKCCRQLCLKLKAPSWKLRQALYQKSRWHKARKRNLAQRNTHHSGAHFMFSIQGCMFLYVPELSSSPRQLAQHIGSLPVFMSVKWIDSWQVITECDSLWLLVQSVVL